MKKVVNNIVINYSDEGEGEAVVLLHGWGSDGSIWDPVREELIKDYRVIVPDVPGFGESDEPEEEWGTEDFAHLFAGFFEALNLNNPHVVGHSNGGRIAIALAAEEKCGDVILVDSPGIHVKKPAGYYAKAYTGQAIKKVLNLKLMQNKKAELVEKQKQKEKEKEQERENNQDEPVARKPMSPMMHKILNRIVDEDLKPLINKITCSTLLIWGSEDTAVPLSRGETMEEILKDNEVDTALIVMRGRGHYCFLEESKRFALICKAFFEGDKK